MPPANEAPSPRKFRHVSIRKRPSGLQFLVKVGDQYVGSSMSELAAAKLAATHTGVPVRKLQLKPKEPIAHLPRRYVGVTLHPQKNLYMARHGAKFLGYAKTEDEAAKLRADAVGAEPNEFRLPSRSLGVPRDEQAGRFAVLWQVYAGGLPGDLESAINLRRSDPAFAFEAPLLWQMALRGKETPWREALMKASKSLAPSGSAGSARSAGPLRSLGHATLMLSSAVQSEAIVGARAAHEALRLAMVEQRGVDRAAWTENTSRNVAHHSGWMPLLQAFGVRGPKGKPLTFNKATLTKFRQAHQVAQLISLVKPPTTTQEWHAAISWLLAEMGRQQLHLAGAASLSRGRASAQRSTESTGSMGYELGWYFRAHLVVEMRAAGISSLKVDSSMSAAEFAALLPDQSQWITALAGPGGSLQNAMRACAYNGPLELFSMYACLFGDQAVLRQPLSFFQDNFDALVTEKAAYQARTGQQPHPAVLVRQVLVGLASAKSSGSH
jgi:hypothetical protein